MITVNTINDLQKILSTKRQQGDVIGFVPTMGNLHQGHMNLLELSLKENDISVISIFVNPTQFSKGEDLSSYPRTFDDDFKKIR